MKLEKELGSYSRWIVKEYLSFRTNDVSAPDRIRDGKTGLVLSVTRVSAGLYTVALRTDRPSITRHVAVHVDLHEINSPPTIAAQVKYVDGSWNQSAGTFQVQVTSFASPPVQIDPDTGSRIAVTLTGSISSVGTDAA